MQGIRCSLVIPTRDRAELLEKCFGALAKQVLGPEDMEVILVDDGSTDGTPQRAESLAHGMPFKSRVLKGKGRGPAAARNIGWRAAKAPLILFTDDDCEPSPGWASGLVEFLHENPHYGGAGGEIRRLYDSMPARYIDDVGCLNPSGEGSSIHYLATANAAYRRTALEMVGGFNEAFLIASGEDPDLCVRLRSCGVKLGKAPGAIVRHNHPSSLTGVYRMYHRYGKGEYVQAQQGNHPCQTRGEVGRLLREWKRCVMHYARRRDLSLYDRMLFCVFGLTSGTALFAGFRSQRRSDRQARRHPKAAIS